MPGPRHPQSHLSAALRVLASGYPRTSLEAIALLQGARLIDQHWRRPPPRPDRAPDYYLLTPGWEHRQGDPEPEACITTAAVLTCCVTGQVLAGMGGGALAIHPSVINPKKEI